MKILILIASRLVSALVGWLTRLHLPTSLNLFLLQCFVSKYKVNLAEAELGLDMYCSLADFFQRNLAPNCRNFDKSPNNIISPVDAHLREIGRVGDNNFLKVKNIEFDWVSFLGNTEIFSKYAEGSFFNFYLSPKDYHHVHFPLAGMPTKVLHMPGAFLPVNDWSISRFPNLFVTNERLVVEINAGSFSYLQIMIAALNVGSMKLEFADNTRSNFSLQSRELVISDNRTFQTGQRFGSFALGSSVVLIFPKNCIEVSRELSAGPIVLGSSIARRCL